MSSVFICHNCKDKPFVRRLADDFRSAGVRVWLDEAELKVGDSLILKIADAIGSFDYLVACISPNTAGSSWVQKELSIAVTMEIKGNKVKVLPIILPGTEDHHIPNVLLDKFYADVRSANDYPTALDLLLRRVKPEAEKKIIDHLKRLNSVICPKCSASNESGALLCGSCRNDFLQLFTRINPYECPHCHYVRAELFEKFCNKCSKPILNNRFLFSVPIENKDNHRSKQLTISAFFDKTHVILNDDSTVYLYDLTSSAIVVNFDLDAWEVLAIKNSTGHEHYNLEVCSIKSDTTTYYQLDIGKDYISGSFKYQIKVYKKFSFTSRASSAAFPELMPFFFLGTFSGKLLLVSRSDGSLVDRIDARPEKDEHPHSIDCIAENWENPEVICLASDDDQDAKLWATDKRFLGSKIIDASPRDCQFIGRHHWSKVAILYRNKVCVFDSGVGGSREDAFRLISTLEASSEFESFLYGKDGTIFTGHRDGSIIIWTLKDTKYVQLSRLEAHLSPVGNLFRVENGNLWSCAQGEVCVWNL